MKAGSNYCLKMAQPAEAEAQLGGKSEAATWREVAAAMGVLSSALRSGRG